MPIGVLRLRARISRLLVPRKRSESGAVGRVSTTNNPWLAIAGKYQDDPNWDEYQAAVAAARQAANESEGICLDGETDR
jgi:hypothetical protein